jgi:hypothetical protein
LKRSWLYNDLQSFTVLRFTPPELMGYQGRSLVVDPDVFCISDINQLLTRDMQGKAVMARHRAGSKEEVWASSVMLLDNPKLTHWKVEENFEEMFRFERDYMKWITLQLEPQDSIGLLETFWNDFDKLTPETRMIHNTKRQTQPWKSGLPVDFRPRSPRVRSSPRTSTIASAAPSSATTACSAPTPATRTRTRSACSSPSSRNATRRAS